MANGDTFRPKRAYPDKLMARGLTNVLSGMIRPMIRYRFIDTDYLPRSGGFIAVANHASDFDALTFTDFLFANGFKPHIMAKEVLFKIPVFATLMKDCGMIPVKRGSTKAADSLKAAEVLLEQGACVALFPEGTLTRDPDLWPMEGKTGVARLALASRAPVIPCGQWGAVNVMGRYSKVIKPFPPKLIAVKVGPPVDLSEYYDREITGELLREVTSKIMDAISDLVGDLRGETPPKPRFDLHLHPDYKKKKEHYPPVVRP